MGLSKIRHLLVITIYVFTTFPVFALSPSEVFKKVSPSIVVVRSTETKLNHNTLSGSQGSGVVFEPQTVITNFHVIANAPYITIEYKGKKYEATLIYADMIRDLAQLSVPGLKAPSVKLKSYKNINTGDSVFAVGAPKGLDLTLSQGLVSSIREEKNKVTIQTSSAISHGSSGGGLFSDKGVLIGITTAIMKDSQNLNFAVPTDYIKDLEERSLVSSPEEANLLLMCGFYSQKKDLAKLIETTASWLTISPENYYAQVTFGDACLQMGLVDSAIVTYISLASNKFIGCEDFAIAAYKGLGAAYATLHRYRASTKAYATFVKKYKKRNGESLKPMQLILVADSYEKMGKFYEKINFYKEAIDCNLKVEDLIPSSPAPPLKVGRLFREQKKYTKALEAMKRAERKAKVNIKPHINFELGRTYLEMKATDKAIKCFDIAKRGTLFTGMANAELGHIYYSQKEYDKALRAYEKAVAANPEEVEVYGPLGRLYFKNKKYKKAITSFEKYLNVAPTDYKSWSLLGKSKTKTKEYDEAIDCYRRSSNLDGSTFKDLYYLSLLLLKSKDYSEAAEMLKEAIKMKPGVATLHFKLGKIYVALKNKTAIKSEISKLESLNTKAATKLKRLARSRRLY